MKIKICILTNDAWCVIHGEALYDDNNNMYLCRAKSSCVYQRIIDTELLMKYGGENER